MALSAQDKIAINHRIVEALRLRLLDKEQGSLPKEGKYYYPQKPHEASTIGSIAAQPKPEEMQGQFPPPPNSMGLAFLASPNADGKITLRVEGHFDLEYAYIPNYSDMLSVLIIENDKPRDKQDLPEAFIRYGITFYDLTFEIDTIKNPSGNSLPLFDCIETTLEEHRKTIYEDPRVFRKRSGSNVSGTRIHSIPWDESITNQTTLNKRVADTLFEPGGLPLPYKVGIECRYRHFPSLTEEGIENAFLVEIHLINYTTEEEANQYRLFRHRILDVGFAATIIQGQHHKMRFNLAPSEYRFRDSQWINGYGQACALVCPEKNKFATEILPRFEQPWIETPTDKQVGMKRSPTFTELAKEPIPILQELIKAMKEYLLEWDSEVSQLETAKDPSTKHAREDYNEYKAEITWIQQGVEQLEHDKTLQRAFQLMNQTMGRAIKQQGKVFTGWRLFQISFIVSQLGSIQERVLVGDHPLDSSKYADVLWFATGGGKTEAYLGLITIAMFYQRLHGRDYGVTAWLRFPLRMLSVQQFQRLAYVLGQANEIKATEGIGGHPFTVGYFTGGGTPGRISSTSDYAQWSYLPNLAKEEEQKNKLRFINRCPHCGSSVEVQFKINSFRIKHVCQNGTCWSNTQAPAGDYGEGVRGEIGIYVSDEECYRYLPTVLVGTLDKLAVLGHNNFFRKFFGKATHYCPDHGFILQGNCKEAVIDSSGQHSVCPNNSMTSKTRTRKVVKLKDPGFSFLITDELHLLGESLGNFDAHYETLLVELQQQNGGIPPKILGATATIREYENHIHHLYLRSGRRFPVAGRTRLENFYARVRHEEGIPLHRRLYVGMLPIATGPAPVPHVIADANQHYHSLLSELIILSKNDPDAFAERMAITPSLVEKVQKHLVNYLQPTLVYAVRNADADLIMRCFDDDNAQQLAAKEPALIAKRLDGHTDLAEIQDVIEKVERNDCNDPVHEIVATSVVSHGVDIERLNMEFFTGWPKSTSEYLQSSSRSGRTHPGIILAGLSYSKLYEYSIYSRFTEYHKFMDRLIEAVPINRFAPNVLSRTIPGIFTAILFNWARHQDPWGLKINPYESETVRQALKHGNHVEEQLIERMVSSLRLDEARSLNIFSDHMMDEFETDLRKRAKRIVEIFKSLPARYAKNTVADVLRQQIRFGPLQSFRDIEKQVAIKPENEDSRRVLTSVSR